MKKEVFDNQIVFEIESIEDLEKIDREIIDKPYSVRLLEKKQDFFYRTVYSFGKDQKLESKVCYKEDFDGNELQFIEYDKEGKILRKVEYENYPNGDTKWLYEYDDKNNLVFKEFFEEG